MFVLFIIHKICTRLFSIKSWNLKELWCLPLSWRVYLAPTKKKKKKKKKKSKKRFQNINSVIYLGWVPDIGLVRVFANGPGDLGSIPGRVIPKTQKMVLDTSLLNTQHYKVQIKGKVEPSREGVAPSPTPWCSSYRKGSLRVTLDYGRQLYLLTYLGWRPEDCPVCFVQW